MSRRVIIALVSVLALFALSVVGVRLWRRGPVDPIPPPVRTAVRNEKADRAGVDSQLIAASLEAYAAQQRQAQAEAKHDSLRSVARKFSALADALARKAAAAATAQDSATFYREAYEVRTDERDSLLAALASDRDALDAANDRIAVLTRAVGIADTARQRADSVLDAVVASVVVCTVPGTFKRLKCPSRTQSIVGGVLLAVVTKVAYDAVRR